MKKKDGKINCSASAEVKKTESPLENLHKDVTGHKSPKTTLYYLRKAK